MASPELDGAAQMVVERLNTVRADPQSARPDLEAAQARSERLDPLDCSDPRPLKGWKEVGARPPLAPTQPLTGVATDKALDMLRREWSGHVDPDGQGPNDRVRAAGIPLDAQVQHEGWVYSYDPAPGANQVEAIWIELAGGRPMPRPPQDLPRHAVDSLLVDRCVASRGHRIHLMGMDPLTAQDRELGVGWVVQSSDDAPFIHAPGYAAVLSLFTRARSDDTFYLLGVVYADDDGDGRYSVGEGLAGVTVWADGKRTETASGGGWVLPVRDGTQGTLRIGDEEHAFRVQGANVKVDQRRAGRAL